MNYYPHHIGDYLTATAHLTWLEDAAYRRLMDVYYTREQPIPADIAQACRLVRASGKEEKRAVETVLREFFDETPEGWRHGRCDEEIEKAAVARAAAQQNGKKGGRPRKDKPSDNPKETQPVIAGLADQNPDETGAKAPNPNTQSQTQITTSVPDGTGGEPPEPPSAVDLIFALGLPLLTSAGLPEKQARTMLGMFRKQHGDDATVRAIQQCVDAEALEPVGYLQRVLRTQPQQTPARNATRGDRNDAYMQRLFDEPARRVKDMGVIDASTGQPV